MIQRCEDMGSLYPLLLSPLGPHISSNLTAICFKPIIAILMSIAFLLYELKKINVYIMIIILIILEIYLFYLYFVNCIWVLT